MVDHGNQANVGDVSSRINDDARMIVSLHLTKAFVSVSGVGSSKLVSSRISETKVLGYSIFMEKWFRVGAEAQLAKDQSRSYSDTSNRLNFEPHPFMAQSDD